MISGANIFLWLLPLAAAPIIFHLLMRRRRRKILFSTRMFFDRVHPRLTIHRKLHDALLLAARVLLILLLLLALARLTLPGIGAMLGMEGKQTVVAIIDNSASMAGQVKGREDTKLKMAIEGTRTLLANMKEGANAGIVPLVADPRAGEWGGISTNRQALLDFLDKVQVTAAAGNPPRAIEQALAILKQANPAGGGSVHIFTDLQEHEWKDQQINAKGVGENVHVYFHRVSGEPAKLPNVCLAQAKISSRRILPRQPYHVELLLRNDGDKEVEIRVNMQEQEQTAADTTKVTIAAGAKQIVKLGFQAQTPGAHWIRIWIDGDGFAGDNRASLAYICEPTGDIAFIGGRAAADFGVLPLAFSPAGDGSDTSLVPGFRSLQELPALVGGKKPMLVVLKWSDACALDGQTAERLGEYVRQGGHLLVLPAVAGAPPSGNPPEWLGAGVEKVNVLAEDAPLVVAGGTSEFWADLRGSDGKVNFGAVHVKQYHALTLRGDAGYEPLLGTGDNRTVLAIRKLGDGQITVSGIAFAGKRDGVPEWSTLPTKKVFLVMVQPMALGAVSSLATRTMSIVAGNAPGMLPGKEAEVQISTLVGDQVEWSGPRDQVPVLVREGAYMVRAGKREMCLSVMPADTEGGTAFIEGPVVAAMGGIAYSVGDLTDGNKFGDEIARSVAGLELYIPLLLLAIVAFMAEGLIGSPSRWRSDRSAREQEGLERPPAARAAKSKVEGKS